ncbi:hypothetical protein AB6C88_22000 [Vibrio splendidus]
MEKKLHLNALEKQTFLKVKKLCAELETVKRTGTEEKTLEEYIQQVTHAAWLDYQPEARDMNKTFSEKEEDLIEHVVSDVTAYLRRNALIRRK